MKLLTFIFFIIFSFISLVNSADDPFYKNLEKESIKRHDLSNTALYSIQSLKLVATLLASDSDNINKLKNTSEAGKSFFKNLALIELPGSEDQVFIYEGQMIGKNNARIKKITKNKVILDENQKEIIMEIVQ